MSAQTGGDRGGHKLAVVVFVVGVLLLALTFILAIGAFSGLSGALRRGALTLDAAGGLLALTAARAALLITMAYASSLLASKGIELYAVASGKPTP